MGLQIAARAPLEVVLTLPAGDGLPEQDCTLIMARPTEAELSIYSARASRCQCLAENGNAAEATETMGALLEWLSSRILDWAGVTADDGDPLPFPGGEEALLQLSEVNEAAPGLLLSAYVQAYAEARAGNSAGRSGRS